MTDVKILLQDHQLYHSEFQQDYFITVRSGGTVYGMYKQALRELFKRYRGLKELYTDKELLQVDIDELTETHSQNVYEQRRNDIKRTQKIMAMEDLERNIQDTEREYKRFWQQADALKQQIGELTKEKRDMLDREMWEYKLKEMAAIDLVSAGRLSNTTYEMLIACPSDIRGRVLQHIKESDNLIDWMEVKETILLEDKT
jgi:septal ring factor EnvC (AmiA/AmiB activator)